MVSLPNGSTATVPSLFNLFGSFTLGPVMTEGPFDVVTLNYGGISVPLFFFDGIPFLEVNGGTLAFLDGMLVALS